MLNLSMCHFTTWNFHMRKWKMSRFSMLCLRSYISMISTVTMNNIKFQLWHPPFSCVVLRPRQCSTKLNSKNKLLWKYKVSHRYSKSVSRSGRVSCQWIVVWHGRSNVSDSSETVLNRKKSLFQSSWMFTSESKRRFEWTKVQFPG